MWRFITGLKLLAKKVEQIRSNSVLEVVEMDEMHTYISSKKISDGYGLLLIAMAKNSSTSCLAIATR